MSGDLEDFLRRAAQRRQAKAAPQPTSRQKPEYSNSRTERRVRDREADEVLVAEIVEDDPNSFAARLRRVEAAKLAAAKAEAELAPKRQASGTDKTTTAPARAVLLSGDPRKDLRALLRQPGGIRQAILLREILDRPEHRW
jgi:hypothetical protein